MPRWNELAEELMQERYPALLAYANMLTAGNRAPAEDLVHDAFVRAFGRGRSFSSAKHAEYYVRRASPAAHERSGGNLCRQRQRAQ